MESYTLNALEPFLFKFSRLPLNTSNVVCRRILLQGTRLGTFESNEFEGRKRHKLSPGLWLATVCGRAVLLLQLTDGPYPPAWLNDSRAEL